MADDKYDILFHVDDNIGDVITRLSKMSDHLEDIQDDLGELSTKTMRDMLRGINKMEKGFMDVHDAVQDAAADSDFGHAFKKNAKEVDKLRSHVQKLQDSQISFQQAVHEGNDKLADQHKKAYEERFKLLKREKAAVLDSLADQSAELKKVFVEDKKMLNQMLKEDVPRDLGTGIGNAISAALSGGDLQGVIGGLTQAGGGVARFGAGKAGNLMEQRALKQKMSGAPAGKMAAVGGGATKALAGIARVAGPLAAAAGGIALVVKMLMDAEAQTKELNKTLLDQVPFYSMAQDGFGAANERLEQMRESATDFSTNMRLGLEPQMHYEVINALNEHGANLRELEGEYQNFGDFASSAVEAVRIASLNLGASMGEVSEFAAIMTDLHTETLDQVSSDLALITDQAVASGTSTKKFFGTVAQITGQMGLYNYKLGETVTVLSQMHKIMDSETAAKFTESMTTGMKNMSSEERLQTMELAGRGKVMKRLRETSMRMLDDLQRLDPQFLQINTLLEEMGYESVSSGEELKGALALLKKEGKYKQFMAQANLNMGEKLGRALSDAGRMASDVEAGGLRALDAMGNIGAIDNMSMQLDKLSILGPIDSLPAILAQQLGVDEEQLIALKKYEEYGQGMTDALMRQFQAFKDGQISESDFEAFAAEMGLNAAIEDGNLVNSKTGQKINDLRDVMLSMTDKAREDAEGNSKTQKSAAQKQIEATESVTKVLQYLIYDVLNSIGGYAGEIYGLLAKFLPGTSDQETDRLAKVEALRTAEGQSRNLRKRQMRAQTPEEKAALQKELEAAEKRKKVAQAQLDVFDKHSGQMYTGEGEIRSDADINKGRIEQMGRLGLSDYGQYEGMRKVAAGKAQRIASDKFGDLPLKEFNEKRDELTEKLLREAVAQKKLDEKSEEIQAEVLAQTEKGASLTEATNRVLSDSGIALSQSAKEDFLNAMGKALVTAEHERGLINAGFTGAEAKILAQEAYAGNMFTKERAGQLGVKYSSAKAEGYAKVSGVHTTEDAMFLTGGYAPFKFKPGDLVIDSESLARGRGGKSGDMIPALAGKLGGGGGPMSVTNHFHINGGNTQEVESTILRVMEQIERRNSGG